MKNIFWITTLCLFCCFGQLQAQKKKIAMVVDANVYSTGVSGSNYDAASAARFMSAFDNYEVTLIEAISTKPTEQELTEQLAEYDLIVLHPTPGGTSPYVMGIRDLVGKKPILNLKSYFYNDGRWSWAEPGNSDRIPYVNVEPVLQNHPIFAGVTFGGDDNNRLALYSGDELAHNSNIQYVASALPFTGSGWNAEWNDSNHTMATYVDATRIQMHELNVNNAAKYILISISMESSGFANLTDDALLLFQNTVEYLTDPGIFYDYENNLPGNAWADKKIAFVLDPTVTVYDAASAERLESIFEGFTMDKIEQPNSNSSANRGHDNEPTLEALTEQYAPYDLIVISTTMDGQNSHLYGLANLVGVKPILNLKPFAYTTGSGSSDRWGWTAPSNSPNTATTFVNVAPELQNHPIFKKVQFNNGDELTVFDLPALPATNNIQRVAGPLPFTGTRWNPEWNDYNHVLATHVDDNAIQMHEINLDNAAKYIMVGISHEEGGLASLSDDLIQLLKNSMMYLLNPAAGYRYGEGEGEEPEPEPTPRVLANINFDDAAKWNVDGAYNTYTESPDMPVVNTFSGNYNPESETQTNLMLLEPSQGALADCGTRGALRFNSDNDWAEIEFTEPVGKLMIYARSGSSGNNVGMVVTCLKASDRSELWTETVETGTTAAPLCGKVDKEAASSEPCIIRIMRTGATLRVMQIYAESLLSSDATLSDLTASPGTLSPAFDPNTTDYTLTVDESVTNVTLTATANYSDARVKGDGEKTLVAGGDNTYEIVVTAEDGSKLTYTVTVVVGTFVPVLCDINFNDASKFVDDVYTESPDMPVVKVTGSGVYDSSRGSDCSPNGGMRLTAADQAIEITFDKPVSILQIYARSTGTNASMRVQIYPVDGGDDITNEVVMLGDNSTACVLFEISDIEPCVVKITRNGGSPCVVRIYAEGFPPVISDDATLGSLTVSAGELWPSFAPDITHYSVEVDDSVNSITLTATANDVGAKVTGAGEKTLDAGDNIFDIVVTAVAGNSMTYTVRVKKITVAAKSFIVTLDPNTGNLPEGASNKINVTRGEAVGALPVPLKPGHTFDGWNPESDGSGDFFTAGTIYDLDGDITLYAQWKVNTYTLRFETQVVNIQNPPDMTVNFGVEVGELPEVSREGDIFEGWNTDLKGGGETFTASTVYNKEGNMTLYAMWHSLATGEIDNVWTNLKLYPNPATDVVTISGLEGGEQIAFFDVSGRRWIYTNAINDREDISVKDLPKGTYLVSIAKGKTEKVIKVVVK